METNQFFIMPGSGPYGPRIFVREGARSAILTMLKSASVWRGHDKTFSLDDTIQAGAVERRVIGFEFSNHNENMRWVLEAFGKLSMSMVEVPTLYQIPVY